MIFTFNDLLLVLAVFLGMLVMSLGADRVRRAAAAGRGGRAVRFLEQVRRVLAYEEPK